jgi:hypothetical protein
MKRHERLLGSTLGLFCTVTVFYPSSAWAEDASAAETAAARSLAVDGLKLAQAGNCVDAVPKLERAEKLYHSAVVASRLGECDVSIGRLVEGTEILRKVLREPQPAEPTPALTKALERAQRVLDAAKPRIAGLTIKVASVQDMSVKVDGNAVASALVDTEIPTDPGEHSVEVSAPGFLKSATHVSVSEGEKKSVTVTLSRDPNAAVAAAPAADAAGGKEQTVAASQASPSRPPAPERATPAEHAPSHAAAYVALGFGAAGLATGGVLGLMTMQRHKDLQGKCPDNACPHDQQADVDSAKRLGNFSTIAFGVGGAGLVLGSVLYFTAGSNTADHAQNAPKKRFAGLVDPRIGVGPASIQLDAAF